MPQKEQLKDRTDICLSSIRHIRYIWQFKRTAFFATHTPFVLYSFLYRLREKDIHVPVIAGGLIQTKQEVMEALRCGATAVSTGCKELWYL